LIAISIATINGENKSDKQKQERKEVVPQAKQISSFKVENEKN